MRRVWCRLPSSGGPHRSELTWTRRLQICCPPSRVQRMWSLGHVSRRGGVGSPNDMVTLSQLLSGSSHSEPSRGIASRKTASGSIRSAHGPVVQRLMLNQGAPGWVDLHWQPSQEFDKTPAMVSPGPGPILQPFCALVGRSSPGGFPPLDAPLRGHGGHAGGHQRGRLVDRPRLRSQDTGLDRPSCRAAALAHLNHRPGPPSTAIPRVVPFPTEKIPSRLRKDLRNVA